MNENIAPGQSRFRASRDPFFFPPPPPRFTRSKEQPPSPVHPRRPAARGRQSTVAESRVFHNTREHQPRVQRTPSDCRQQIPPRHQNKTHDYLDYGPKVNFPPKQPPPALPTRRPVLTRPFFPMPPKSSRPMTPIFYPPRHLPRKKQMQIRLFPASRF